MQKHDGGICMSDNIREDLKENKKDYLYSTVKAGLSSIPLAGSVVGEFFSMIVSQPISKRRDEWLVRIKNELEELQSKFDGFDINNLCNNEVFITVLMQASQIAIKNHQEEKLIALKNAVLNSAVEISIDENVQLMYINYIDELTPWHLKILTFFKNPTEWFNENNKSIPSVYMGSPSQILAEAFDELNGRREFYDLIIKELYTKGLLNIDSVHTMMTSSGVFASRTTDFGTQFIKYITKP